MGISYPAVSINPQVIGSPGQQAPGVLDALMEGIKLYQQIEEAKATKEDRKLQLALQKAYLAIAQSKDRREGEQMRIAQEQLKQLGEVIQRYMGEGEGGGGAGAAPAPPRQGTGIPQQPMLSPTAPAPQAISMPPIPGFPAQAPPAPGGPFPTAVPPTPSAGVGTLAGAVPEMARMLQAGELSLADLQRAGPEVVRAVTEYLTYQSGVREGTLGAAPPGPTAGIPSGPVPGVSAMMPQAPVSVTRQPEQPLIPDNLLVPSTAERQPPSPLDRFRTAIRGASPEVASLAVRELSPLVSADIKAQEARAEQADLDRFVGQAGLDPAKQAEAQAVFAAIRRWPEFVKSGLAQKMYPEWFALNDVDRLNAFVGAVRTLGQQTYSKPANAPTLGSIMDAAGVQIPGLDRNLKWTETPSFSGGLGGGYNETEFKMSMHFRMMKLSDAYLTKYFTPVQEGGLGKKDIGWLTAIKANWRPQKGESDLFNTFALTVLNKSIASEDQMFITHMQNFASAWRYAVTGAQATNEEMFMLMAISTPQKGDSDDTIAQKELIRKEIIASIEDGLALSNPVIRLERLLENPNISAEQKELLKISIERARSHTARGGWRTLPPDDSEGATGADPRMLQEVQRSNALLEAIATEARRNRK